MKRAGALDRAIDEWDTEFRHVRPLSAVLASCITATTGEVATLSMCKQIKRSIEEFWKKVDRSLCSLQEGRRMTTSQRRDPLT